ncbi:MAG: hypothetical protein AAFQ20_03480 [Bacteroidota bacterium]
MFIVVVKEGPGPSVGPLSGSRYVPCGEHVSGSIVAIVLSVGLQRGPVSGLWQGGTVAIELAIGGVCGHLPGMLPSGGMYEPV